MLLRCVATLEYCVRLLVYWVLDTAIAARVCRYVLRRVAMLEYCARLLGR
jgi:hypothetical protein